jgi:FkbM family methyltransferase
MPPISFATLRDLVGQEVRVDIVDIGSNAIDGDPPYKPLLASGAADVVGFEPNREALAQLEKRKGPHETYLPHAVADGKQHTLRFCHAQGMTSLLQPNPQVLEMFHGFPEWARVIGEQKIDTVRLDDVAAVQRMDYLKIDIQGGELMVFENAVQRLAGCVVIHTEVEFLPMYVDQPLFSDVDLFLRRQGFVFHRFHPLTSRTLKPMLINNDIYAHGSQLVWADAIFVRDFTQPASLSDRQLLVSALLLHDIYKSYDLVLRLLLEHDRRRQTGFGAKYMA